LIFLDTHSVVWLFEKNLKPFTKMGLRLLDSHDPLISPMVLLELSYLFEIKRTSHTADQIFGTLTREVGLSVDGTPFRTVSETACSLTWTRDTFDRLIVAQAQCSDAPLLTKDETLHKGYPKAMW